MTISYKDVVGRYDLRLILRLCFDDDGNRHFEPELENNAVLNAALEDARGAVQGAIEVADIYRIEDVDRFTPSSASLYKRLVCDKAICLLYKRRGQESSESVSKANEEVEKYLDRIRKGERLFALEDSKAPQEAGKPSLGNIRVIKMNAVTTRVRDYFGDVYRSNSPNIIGCNR